MHIHFDVSMITNIVYGINQFNHELSPCILG